MVLFLLFWSIDQTKLSMIVNASKRDWASVQADSVLTIFHPCSLCFISDQFVNIDYNKKRYLCVVIN